MLPKVRYGENLERLTTTDKEIETDSDDERHSRFCSSD